MKKILLLLSVVFTMNVSASHLTGMDLTYECIGGNQYKFILELYRDCSGVSLGGSENLNIISNCGNLQLQLTSIDLSPNDPTRDGVEIFGYVNSYCSGGTNLGVEKYRYEGVTSLTPCNDWSISWSSCCRNPVPSYILGGSNIGNPSGSGMSIEININNLNYACLNSPNFSSIPVFAACKNFSFTYNQGATDIDGDSLVFTLVEPLDNDISTPVTYNTPYTAVNPLSGSTTLDPNNGNLYLSPNLSMVVIMAVKVDEYRNGDWIGTITRDMQVIIENCSGQPAISSSVISSLNSDAEMLSSNEVRTFANEEFNMTVTTLDASNDNSVVLTGNYFKKVNEEWVLFDSTFYDITEGKFALSNFAWTPTLSDTGTHEILLKIYSKTSLPFIHYFEYPYTIHVVENPNSINSKLSKEFKIYPNPTTNKLNIKLPEGISKANFSILDITGKQYLSEKINKNNTAINLSVPKGIYFVKIKSDKGIVVKKLVVE